MEHLTETQFNDILGTMHSAGITVDGMEIYVDTESYIQFVAMTGSIVAGDVATYESDFGVVIIKRK